MEQVSSQTILVIGHACINKKKLRQIQPQYSFLSLSSQFPEQVIKTFNNSQWKIADLRFLYHNWSTIFKSIEKCTCTKLLLFKNQYVNILKSIQTPVFCNLTSLSLSRNKIKNIESLAFLAIPNLTIFKISGNQIVEFKALDKVHWPNLAQLYINSNFSQNQSFDRLNCSSKQLDLMLNVSYMDNRPNQNIKQLSKLSTKFVKYLFKQLTIAQDKVVHSLKSKNYQPINYSCQVDND